MSELGDFLRSRRTRLTPATVGLTEGTRRRRTPGLRREEVAELAGIGIDWYVRLEQGRTVSPSRTTIDALAKALALTAAEHAHLLTLARTSDVAPFVREPVPPAVRRIVESLAQPAYVTGARWDILAWNRAAADLFGDFGRTPEEDRNVLVFMFLDPRARRLFGRSWADEARRVLAAFRSTHDLHAADPAFVTLLARLRTGSQELERWWEAHDVRRPASGTKSLHHPRKGVQRYEHASFQANDDPALKLVIYAPL